MRTVPRVTLETVVLREALALDLGGLRERRGSRGSQEDPEAPVHLVLKVNRAWRWLRKVYRDPEDWTARRDSPDHRVHRADPDRTASLACREQRGTLDSQASDYRDPRGSKDSQVPTASQDLLQDQEDRESMGSPASPDFLDPRASPALDFPAPQVYREYPEVKVSPDQRETPASPAVPVHLGALDSMDLRDLKVTPVHRVSPELGAHLEPPPLAHWGSQAPPDSLAHLDHQGSLDQTEGRETPALQVKTSPVCRGTEGVPVSPVPLDRSVRQDLLEDLGGTACLDCQVRKETTVPWEPQDLLEAQGAQEDPALPASKVILDSKAGTAILAVRVSKETGVRPASRDPQGPAIHHCLQKEPKEILDYQVLQVFPVRKASPVSPVTPDCQGPMDVLDFPDHRGPREILVSQAAQEVLEVQEEKAAWEKWVSQDHRGRRVSRVSPVGQALQDSREDLVSPEPKVNQALLESDHPDYLDIRVNQVSQGFLEVQDLKEHQDHPVSQVSQEGRVIRATSDSQDSKVLQVSPVLRVLMAGPVVQASMEVPVDQENLADQEDQGCQATRVRQVGTGSRDRLESKETQVFPVTADPVLLGFQGCQVRRETLVFTARLAAPVSLEAKEKPVTPDPPVLQATAVLPDLRDMLCRDPKDSTEPPDHQEEEVPPDHRAPEAPEGAAAFREKRGFLALLDSRDSWDRREIVAVLDSQVPVVFPVVLV